MCEQGGGKSNVDGARGEKILVEERAREREGEECMARRQREDEKSARGKRRCLYFAAAGGVGQKEESICEKCAPGKYFYKVQK